MHKTHTVVAPPAVIAAEARPRRAGALRPLALGAAAVVVLGAPGFVALAQFAFGSDLYSHILLIPVIAGYLAWQRRDAIARSGTPNRRLAVLLLLASASAWAAGALAAVWGWAAPLADRLACFVVGAVGALAGVAAWSLGAEARRTLRFPLAFLLFAAPLPVAWLAGIESLMQHGSAAAANLLFAGAGTPVFHDGLTFQLPGIVLHVARECSGIRSTLVLVIVSTLTAALFLRTPAGRGVLLAALLPIALARNGLRIFVIGELCVRFGPDMIDSIIHRRGGPVFFALSLVPLLGLLLALQRLERRRVA